MNPQIATGKLAFDNGLHIEKTTKKTASNRNTKPIWWSCQVENDYALV